MKSLPDVDMVLFGGTGDLAMRKLLPALYQQVKTGTLSTASRILAAARKPLDRAEFLALAEATCRPAGSLPVRVTAFTRGSSTTART